MSDEKKPFHNPFEKLGSLRSSLPQGRAQEEIAQVAEGVDGVALGALDHGVKDGGSTASAINTEKIRSLSAAPCRIAASGGPL